MNKKELLKIKAEKAYEKAKTVYEKALSKAADAEKVYDKALDEVSWLNLDNQDDNCFKMKVLLKWNSIEGIWELKK